jgi:hypothetical protein
MQSTSSWFIDGSEGSFERRDPVGFSRKTRLSGEIPERGDRPRADMGNHLGGGERAEPRALRKVVAARKPEQEPRRVEVAGAGRVDQFLDRDRIDRDRLVTLEHDRALFGARHGGKAAILADRLQRVLEG